MKNSTSRRSLGILLCTTLIATTAVKPVAFAQTPALLDETAIAPHAGPHGYFVDSWNTNNTSLQSAETNAGIGVLSGMFELWTPGTTWNNGTKVNPTVLDSNIQQSIDISTAASDEEQVRAYVIDRRNQNYTATDGLGAYAEAYRAAVNAGTTIPDTVPAEAYTTKQEDGGNTKGSWADSDGELGSTVQLIEAIRGHSASSNPSKNYFQYPRPYRWTGSIEAGSWGAGVDMPEYAYPLRKDEAEAASDGGFPSGHTSAGHMAVNGLAYAFPQQYDELLLTAAEIGTSRVQLGMHSPLDVMGGRVLSTAITAGVLNDAALDEVKAKALVDGQTWISNQAGIIANEGNYDEQLAEYTEYLTFGFSQTGDTTETMRVPKGAEALLETRLPYLDDEQRRRVLHSTGIESGYPVVNDEEGWGRLNLFAAQAGYGAFNTNVAITMNAEDGGFSAADNWQNDIEGAGSLTKDGSGELTLSGENTYTGGTTLAGGTLVATTANALGTGDLAIEDDATLKLDGTGVENLGTADLDGTLEVTLPAGADLAEGFTVLQASAIEGEFDSVEVTGASDVKVSYTNGEVTLSTTNEEDSPAEATGSSSADNGLLKFIGIIAALGGLAAALGGLFTGAVNNGMISPSLLPQNLRDLLKV